MSGFTRLIYQLKGDASGNSRGKFKYASGNIAGFVSVKTGWGKWVPLVVHAPTLKPS